MTAPKRGKVYLIGAGPGDPGLLTLRGAQWLGAADLVLYDYLANPQILRHARPGAELTCVGRHGHGRIMSQAEITERMIEAARGGRTVARLKGGDPAIFGRSGEEAAALAAAGVDFEVAPGVTAALAASNYTGIPLTHRDFASCVAFVTGRQKDADAAPLDIGRLANFPGTLVFYMGVTTAPLWAGELIAHGKPTSTPVAIIRHATLPRQETLVTTLGELVDRLARDKVRPPALIVVGECVSARAAGEWFSNRPLFGRTVLVTRPRNQAADLVEQLSQLGAEVVEQPAIEIGPARDQAALGRAIAELDSYQWIVFSSANGVAYFMDQLLATPGKDVRALGDVKIAAIGPATAEAAGRYGLKADLQPAEYRAEALAEALAPQARGRRALLVRASRGRETLAETLAAAGVNVQQVVAYESRDVAAADEDVASMLAAGRIDWVIVTSSAIARSLVRMFGNDLRRAKLAAISPLTANVLAEMGHPAAAVAGEFTVGGVVDAIVAAAATS